MRFTPTSIPGVFLIDLERSEDERGYFARSWCREEFAQHGLSPSLVQCNVSYNRRRGTLRGLHYQVPPHSEAKLVRVTQGAIHDVVVDLRPWAPSYLHWISAELNAVRGCALYIPEGCAHGFQTLTDNADVFYQMTEAYHPESTRGIRWNDPALGIRWPIVPGIISDRDRSYPDHLVERRQPCS